jgi:mRNA-degrading endonuclease RelE of RelBE toxin-antitoxin system
MYQSVILPHFKRELKKYLKKHRGLEVDIITSLENFQKNEAVHIGNDIYKIRLKTSSLNKGKSNSFRMLLLVLEIDKIITPVTIFFKGDIDNLSYKEINNHLEIILSELKIIN